MHEASVVYAMYKKMFLKFIYIFDESSRAP